MNVVAVLRNVRALVELLVSEVDGFAQVDERLFDLDDRVGRLEFESEFLDEVGEELDRRAADRLSQPLSDSELALLSRIEREFRGDR